MTNARTNTVTIRFRARRADHVDGVGYKVPILTHSHVTLARRDAFGIFLLKDLNNERVTKARLALRAGLTLPAVVYADSPGDWEIKPIGRGFMADVSITCKIQPRQPGSVEAAQ